MNKFSIRQLRRLFTVLLTALGLSTVGAHGQSTTVTLDMDSVPLKSVMAAIEDQTNYLFLYTDEIDTDRIVSVEAENRPLTEVLGCISIADFAWSVRFMSKRPR